MFSSFSFSPVMAEVKEMVAPLLNSEPKVAIVRALFVLHLCSIMFSSFSFVFLTFSGKWVEELRKWKPSTFEFPTQTLNRL